jgi:GDP-4-dehydro-6-deoxy-D-mannose reductase
VASPKVLITGAHGFIGSRLLSFLNQNGIQASAAELDLLRFESVESVIKNQEFTTLIHLGAISHVPSCDQDPNLAYQTNLGGTALILEAIRRHRPEAHVIFSSTAQVYQAPQQHEIAGGIVFAESRKIEPQNLYALTKWQSEVLLKDFSERNGNPVTVLRLFNHTHRTQSTQFLLPHLYETMKKAGSGAEITIPVGNLKLDRDIGTISDLLKAFQSVIQKRIQGYEVYNVCSGVAKNLESLALKLAKNLNVHANFKVEESRLRPGEPKKLLGSSKKLTQATGWQPHCNSEEELLKEFLE